MNLSIKASALWSSNRRIITQGQAFGMFSCKQQCTPHTIREIYHPQKKSVRSVRSV